MALIALAAAKGSPGCTATAIAFALSWPARVVMAECDPAGGSALAGFLRGQLDADRGMVPLAVAELRNERLAAEFWRQLVDLDPPKQQRLLLPGIADPAQAGSLDPIWSRLGSFFAGLEIRHGYDVFADCGRLAAPAAPWGLLHQADLVLLMLRPDLPSISASAAALRTLRQQLTEYGYGLDRLGLALVGKGPYQPAEVAKQLQTPLVLELPEDPKSAAALCFGGKVRRGWPLLKATARAVPHLRALVARNRPAPLPVPVDGEALRVR